MIRNVSTAACCADCRSSRTRRLVSAPNTAGLGLPTRREPVEVMISVRLRTLRGCLIAMVCAMNPPIEAPTKCTESRPNASISPTPSAAMSSIV